MEKNENIDQQSVSKAVAHNVEAADVIFATAYQEPPPLFTAADPTQSKKELETEEETSEKESTAEISPQVDEVQSPDPVGINQTNDVNLIPGAVAPKKEEPKEELIESPDVELVFAAAPPDDDGQGDGEENNGAGGQGGGDGNDDLPIQNKLQDEEEESIQRKTKESSPLEELEEPIQKQEATIQRDSNLDLLESGGHPKRNQHNEFPQGILRPSDGSSNPTFEYIEGNNIFIDEAGRFWTMLSDEQNVYHQPPEIVDGFMDNQMQNLSHWWNNTDRPAFPNKKFISDDGDTGGSFEAILQPDSDGGYSNNWLNTGTQQGTYNFYSPEGIGGNAGHVLFDIIPHFLNDTYDDTPTQEKRSRQESTSTEHKKDQSVSLSPPTYVMEKMEASFGTSFSDVRIHENSSEAADNGALAFAKGKDVFFAPGQYNPQSKAGQELLGHELAHVVQQKQGRVKPTKNLKNGTKVNDDPALEQEADELGAKAASFSLSRENKVVSKEGIGLLDNVIQRQVPESEPAEIDPDDISNFTPEQIAEIEAEFNEPIVPEKAFKKVVLKPKPPKKITQKTPIIKLEPKGTKPELVTPKTPEKSGADKAFSPPSSNVSAEGISIRAYLDAASQPALDDGKSKARGLETNERRNEGAMVKTSNAKKAVTAPPGEDQSRKDGEKTRETDAKETPEVRKEKANSEFQKSLDDSLPQKIKDVEKFKGSSKARKITDKAKFVISEDKDTTTETYESVIRTEFKLANENNNPIPLGPIEEAEITAPFNIADKIVPDLKPLKSHFEGSTTDVELKMAEQGATTENMALAKSSKLDEFKKNKGEFTELETNLDSTLDGIYQEGAQKTSTDFEEAEEKGRTDMRDERDQKLNEAKDDQETTTGDLEAKRLEIVEKINSIYDPVEKKVNERLNKLDETTRVEFENGMNDATKEFEDNVNTRFKAFKKKRYKGWRGKLKWVKDKFVGVNGIQEVKDILSSERDNYEKNIDKLIEDITGRNAQVIELCKREINEAKTKIDEYIDSLPDALKEIARDASKEIKDKLIALEDSVKEKEKELENLLGELRQEAMDWVDEKIAEYKEKWGGILSAILDFLGDLAMAILEGLLVAAGVDPSVIIDIVKQAVSAIIAIIKDPIGFFKSLIQIVKDGFTEFFSGGLKNLFSAFLEWLTGSDGTVVFPTEWTLKNILLMLLDFFGLGWETIKGYFAEELGPEVVNFAVGAVQLIQLIMEKGPIAVFEMMKDSSSEIVSGGWSMIKEKYGDQIGDENIQMIEMFADLLQKVAKDGLAGIWEFIKDQSAALLEMIKGLIVDAIVDYAKIQVIKAGIKALIKMASGIIGWIVAAYDTVKAFIESYSTIAALIGAILKSVMHAANRAIAAGVQLIMEAIKLLISAILTFICEFLGLGDIPGAVQGAIANLIGAVQDFIKGIIKWISDKLKMLWEKVKNFFSNLFGSGDEEGDGEGESEAAAEGENDLSHSINPLNGQGMDSKGGGFNFSWGGSGGGYDFGGSPYGGGENARSVDLQKGEMMGAEDDAEFQAEVTQLTNKAEEQKEHETTDQKVSETVDAAESPSNEVESKAKSKQVDVMGEANADDFDAGAFKRKLLDKIDSIAPDSMEKTMNFKSSGSTANLKDTIATDVKSAGVDSKKDIEEAASESPDKSGFDKKVHTPLPPEPAAPDRGAIAKEKAAPKTQPDEVFVAPIEEEKTALEQQYTDAEITDEQLTAANEPTFTAALNAKNTATTNMDSSVTDMRAGEQEVIQKAQGEAQTEGDEKLDAFLATNQQEVGNVSKDQQDGKSKDEAERKKVSDKLESIYATTKSQVEAKLNGIESTVMSMFDSAAASAKSNFENHVDSSMKAYKEERYSGAGLVLWAKDKLFGLPSEVEIFYTQARDGYVSEMDSAMVSIADFVADELNAAKQLIASGKDDINKYVDNLDPNLQKFAKEAATKITAKFTALEETVAAKQTELIDNLAQKYTDNLGAIDTKIDELMESNKGFIQSAVDGITGVIETIKNMRDMLTSVINDGLAVINEILKDPIGFLSNLLQGVKGGFNQFASNIGSHLKEGMSNWLFGTLGEAGLQIPASFDIAGILSVITQVVGLTWDYIRTRIVNFIGEENMARLETTIEMFKAFKNDGVKGFKEAAGDKAGEIKEDVMGEVKEFLVVEVVKKGIMWLVSLFNPAAAFVKACKAIYDIVIFFVNRGAQMMDLVQSIIGSISAVVGGNIGAMANAIEGTLSKGLPLAIGFIASLLGLGSLATKVKSIFKKAQAPVNKVVEKVVGKARDLAGKFTGKDGDKDDENENDENAEKDEKWDKGVESLIRLQTSGSSAGKTEKQMDDALRGIKSTHGFDRLTKSADGDFWEVSAKKGAKKRTIDIKADFEGKVPDDQAADPEVEAKAQEGFAELRQKAAKYEGDGASKEEADKLVGDVKKKFPVFKILSVIDSEGDFDVRASYNPDKIFTDEITKAEIKENKDSGHLLTSTSLASYQDLTIKDRDKDSAQKVGHDATTTDGKQGIVVGNAGKESEYVEKVKKQGAEGSEFNVINPLGIPARRSHIGKAALHIDYEPQNIILETNVDDSGAVVFVLHYDFGDYKEDEGGPKNFTIKIMAVPGNKLSHVVEGRNLIIDRKHRGKKESHTNIDQNQGANIDPNTSQLDESHLLADLFTGSGYRKALNVVVTSKNYNRGSTPGIKPQTMIEAERTIERRIELLQSNYEDEKISFNLEVKAIYSEIGDNKIYNDIKALNHEEMNQKTLEATYAKLQENQNPKLCHGIDYNVLAVKVGGENSGHKIKSIIITEDEIVGHG